MGMGNIANSGMQAAMSDMDVISNNVANADTPGFKKSSARFADLFPIESGSNSGNLQIGLGVTLSGIEQNFDPAGFTPTDSASDIYIPGSGFLVTKDSTTGDVTYTRLGHFKFGTTTGYFSIGNRRLQGYPAVNGKIPSGGTISDLHIDTSSQPAKASSTVTASGLNLNSANVIPTTTPFSATDSTSYNYSTHSTLYDSLGNSHNLDLYYVKTGANAWSVYTSVDSNVLNASTPGTLAFNQSGKLTSATGLSGFTYTPSTGAQALNFSVDMSSTTQYGSPNSSSPFTTDGYPAGTFSGYTIDTDGVITSSYSNGVTQVSGQIALANFQNPAGLQNDGSGTWSASTDSGQAIINQANSTSNIRQKALEVSNVDLATELVNLTGAQNTFQANAQVEQVYNHVMETVTKL